MSEQNNVPYADLANASSGVPDAKSDRSDQDQDALRRITTWLDRLEDQARRLLEAFQPEELEPVQAANVAGKYITLIARLLELRQQFTTETSSEEERLLRIIFGDALTKE